MLLFVWSLNISIRMGLKGFTVCSYHGNHLYAAWSWLRSSCSPTFGGVFGVYLQISDDKPNMHARAHAHACVRRHNQNRCPNKVLMTRSSASCCSCVGPIWADSPICPSFCSVFGCCGLSVCRSLTPPHQHNRWFISGCDKPAPNTSCTVASIFCCCRLSDEDSFPGSRESDQQADRPETGRQTWPCCAGLQIFEEPLWPLDSCPSGCSCGTIVPSASIMDGQLMRMEQHTVTHRRLNHFLSDFISSQYTRCRVL